MKLAHISKAHIVSAAKIIDKEGIPSNYLSNQYWISGMNGGVYPFKYSLK